LPLKAFAAKYKVWENAEAFYGKLLAFLRNVGLTELAVDK
jgi:hypothetical protein